jgi:hypothetical protein
MAPQNPLQNPQYAPDFALFSGGHEGNATLICGYGSYNMGNPEIGGYVQSGVDGGNVLTVVTGEEDCFQRCTAAGTIENPCLVYSYLPFGAGPGQMDQSACVYKRYAWLAIGFSDDDGPGGQANGGDGGLEDGWTL